MVFQSYYFTRNIHYQCIPFKPIYIYIDCLSSDEHIHTHTWPSCHIETYCYDVCILIQHHPSNMLMLFQSCLHILSCFSYFFQRHNFKEKSYVDVPRPCFHFYVLLSLIIFIILPYNDYHAWWLSKFSCYNSCP